MEDNRNLIEQAQANAKLITGSELSPREMAMHFAKLPFAERVEHLDRLNVDLAQSDLTISQAVQLVEYSDALHQMQATLRKIGR